MSGYDPVRAISHELLVGQVVEVLRQRGYAVEQLPVDGHRPDLRVRDRVGRPYIECKTGRPNLTVEINDFKAWRDIERDEGERVYIVHASERGWTVDTPDSLTRRIIGGPRRRSGNGSRDDWYKIVPGGTSFDWYFPDTIDWRAEERDMERRAEERAS